MPKKMVFNKDALYVGVRPSGSVIGLMAKGTLTLDGKSYSVISGPWTKGVLPNATYTVKKYKVVADSDDEAYQSPTGKGWFIPLAAPANVNRQGLGIHPDGNVEGTQGCIGIVGTDADAFWKGWLALSMHNRPDTLEVQGASEKTNATAKHTINVSGVQASD